MFFLSLQQVLLNIVAAGVVGSVYGFTAAAMAAALGDYGPKRDGRRTVSPISHFGALGFLAMMLFRMGWIRPVDVRPKEARAGRWAPVGVVAGGMAALLLLAFAANALRPVALQLLSGNAGLTVSAALNTIVMTSLGTAVLNLLPLPPLAGGLLWRTVHTTTAQRLESIARYIAIAVFVVLVTSGAVGVLNEWRTALRAWLGM
ncbi:MAG: hypothetical protein U5K81_00645 [Trueperaceae bacterium]|nr:hypothetical protein [Trueperaceae bacterium]